MGEGEVDAADAVEKLAVWILWEWAWLPDIFTCKSQIFYSFLPCVNTKYERYLDMVLYTKRNRRMYYFIRRTFLSGKGNLNFPLSSLTLQLPQIMVATKYGHVIGLCPYFSSGCFKLNISIIEGAHPKLQAIEFTKENIRWCCAVMNHKQNLADLHFFQEKHSQKDFFAMLIKELTMDWRLLSA